MKNLSKELDFQTRLIVGRALANIHTGFIGPHKRAALSDIYLKVRPRYVFMRDGVKNFIIHLTQL